LLTDDEGIREINKQWRGKDRPTDVIAFSQIEGEPFPTDFLGDIVISVETAARQAEEIGHSLGHEMDRLVVHGILHLLGYQHAKGGRQAARMRRKEEELTELVQEGPS